jgi:hemerythrin-like domain-containing protein
MSHKGGAVKNDRLILTTPGKKSYKMPIAPLMIEHRLIERVVKLLAKESNKINAGNNLNTGFIHKIIDFFKIYADGCHHGKEEDILFSSLARKEMMPQHRALMDDLLEDHKKSRALVKNMEYTTLRYRKSDQTAKKDITGFIQELVKLYTTHIEKEDKHFFIPSMKYFTEEEQSRMSGEFNEFDRLMIHKEYNRKVEKLEQEC